MRSAQDQNERYLGLTGLVTEQAYANTTLTARLDHIKEEIFGTHDVVLHRREIIDKKPAPFDRLNDARRRARFDELLIQLIEDAHYTAITVVIAKKEHSERYAVWQFQPYHYCLTNILERYVRWLDERNGQGDVVVESRGKKTI